MTITYDLLAAITADNCIPLTGDDLRSLLENTNLVQIRHWSELDLIFILQQHAIASAATRTIVETIARCVDMSLRVDASLAPPELIEAAAAAESMVALRGGACQIAGYSGTGYSGGGYSTVPSDAHVRVCSADTVPMPCIIEEDERDAHEEPSAPSDEDDGEQDSQGTRTTRDEPGSLSACSEAAGWIEGLRVTSEGGGSVADVEEDDRGCAQPGSPPTPLCLNSMSAATTDGGRAPRDFRLDEGLRAALCEREDDYVCDVDFKNELYLVHHAREIAPGTDARATTVGTIKDAEGAVVCRSFGLVHEYVVSSFPRIVDFTECRVFESHEGTMVRLYEHRGKWFLSTNKRIDAHRSRWGYNIHACRSFGKMFIDALREWFAAPPADECSDERLFDAFCARLDPGFVYAFLVCNDKFTRKVCVATPNEMLYLGKFDRASGFAYDPDAPMTAPDGQAVYEDAPRPRELEFASNGQIAAFVGEIDASELQGVFVALPDNTQFKVMSLDYIHKYNLRGNVQSIMFRYLQLYENEFDRCVFASMYPEHRAKFAKYDAYVDCVVRNILAGVCGNIHPTAHVSAKHAYTINVCRRYRIDTYHDIRAHIFRVNASLVNVLIKEVRSLEARTGSCLLDLAW